MASYLASLSPGSFPPDLPKYSQFLSQSSVMDAILLFKTICLLIAFPIVSIRGEC